ncbi:MAG: hypothetical protein ACK5QC_04820 [Bacteroidota bacterium]|jgi:hypothetical protein
MKSIQQTLSFWFAVIMVIATIIIGTAFLFTDVMSDSMYGRKRTIFICLMFAYSAYRGFRLYAQIKTLKNDKEN